MVSLTSAISVGNTTGGFDPPSAALATPKRATEGGGLADMSAADVDRVPSAASGLAAAVVAAARGPFEVAMETEAKLQAERRRRTRDVTVAPGGEVVLCGWRF